MDVQQLPAMLIDAPPEGRIRPVDKKKAQEIADSIREVGLLTPLIVKPGSLVRNGQRAPGWHILAGNHRFEALFRILNWKEIPCIVTDADGLRAELLTIDENLVRRELSDAERAYQTARRKEIYEALHPETRMGGAPGAPGGGKRKREGRQFGDDAPDRFSASTSKATGRSERTIQREAERGEKLGPILNRIAGTSLDKGVEIDALADLPIQEREDIVARAESGERVSARKPTPPNIVALDTDEMQATTIARRLMRDYLEATPRAREAFDGLYEEDRRGRATING